VAVEAALLPTVLGTNQNSKRELLIFQCIKISIFPHKNVNKTNNSLTAATSLTTAAAIKSAKEASGDSGSGGRTPTTSVRN